MAATPSPLVRRLRAFCDLDGEQLEAVDSLHAKAERFDAGRTVVFEGATITRAVAVADGWLAQSRLLPDGRRQILGFLLPGDVVHWCHHPQPIALWNIDCLTQARLVGIPPRSEWRSQRLAEALDVAAAVTDSFVYTGVARLGRQSAYERIALLLLELYDRLVEVGRASMNSFHMPLSQQVLAEALGLSIVHVNRILMQLARDGRLERRHRTITIPDREALAALVHYAPPVPLPRHEPERAAPARPYLVASVA